MARIRTIKPEFATDEKLAKVSRDARLTFVLCITQADDDGLLPGNHRQLLASLYPLDDAVTYARLAGWLEELADLGRLRWRETVDGSPILEIVNWSSHQKVDHKGKSLILPHLKPVPEDGANVSRAPREDGATVSRSDLGPRTMDHGPSDGASAPVVEKPKGSAFRADVEFVLAHYVRTHPRRRPGPSDRKAVERAFGWGYAPSELCEAITGNAEDDWHRERKKHELPYVLRNNGLIDGFRAKSEVKPLVIVDGWFADAMP
jgi:hypothetical protein